MTLEADILKRIRPSAAENKKVLSVAEELSEKVVSVSRSLKVHVEPMLVGSVAKGTHLKGPDIDLFMLFPESTTVDELRSAGLEIGRKIIGGREHFAQHPYVRGDFKGFQVDLVPAFRIRDTRRKMSAVDRTPFHTEFVRENLEKGREDEVRLLKRFMKGVECYGAEAKVQGFSGYLCELLVMRFGSFRAVLEAAKEWKVGEALELPGHPGKEFPEPLTFVDPVDATRNVASAVVPDTLVRFVQASREYLRSQSEKFFFPSEVRTFSSEEVRGVAGDRLDNIIAISFPRLNLIDDVVYPQLRKSLSAVTALLEREEFEIEKTSLHIDSATHLTVELAAMTLPKTRKHRGPPVRSENVDEFLAKWRTGGVSAPYVDDNRWWVMRERKWVRGDELVKAMIEEIPLGKDVKEQGRFSVESGPDLLKDEHLESLTHHFDQRMPWER
jgi:tRNA nucleotidyltransferase (CCA-adding enzyme)